MINDDLGEYVSLYQRPVIDGVPCSQETAQNIINDLDSNNPEIRERGNNKLKQLEAEARGCGKTVDLIELHRVAKSAWTPETMQNGAMIALGVWIALAIIVSGCVTVRFLFF